MSVVLIDYTNWKGVRRKRRIEVISITRCSSPPWHLVVEWMAHAVDLEDGVRKCFPLRNIHSWTEVSP